jgi:hypothetical protein
MKKESRAPLIVATVLLLLPVLYVGSYLALVTPHARFPVRLNISSTNLMADDWEHYRLPGKVCGCIFWPLEQIDRKVRPGFWQVYPTPIRPITFPPWPTTVPIENSPT